MMKLKLVIEIDVELLDETWSEKDLAENSVYFFCAAIEREERDQALKFPNPPFTVDVSDLTVWTKGDYLLDLADEKSTEED